jgi:hypothetical protein
VADAAHALHEGICTYQYIQIHTHTLLKYCCVVAERAGVDPRKAGLPADAQVCCNGRGGLNHRAAPSYNQSHPSWWNDTHCEGVRAQGLLAAAATLPPHCHSATPTHHNAHTTYRHKIPSYVNHIQTIICKTTIIPSHRPRQRGMSPVQFECRQDPVVPVWLASRWGPETHLFPMTTWCLRGIHGCTQYPPQ